MAETSSASTIVAPVQEVSEVGGVCLLYLCLFVIRRVCFVVPNRIKWYLGVWIFKTSLVLGGEGGQLIQ